MSDRGIGRDLRNIFYMTGTRFCMYRVHNRQYCIFKKLIIMKKCLNEREISYMMALSPQHPESAVSGQKQAGIAAFTDASLCAKV